MSSVPSGGLAGAVPVAVLQGGPPARLLAIAAFPLFAVATGVWVYRDSRRRGHGEWALLLGVVVGGLFLTGTLPALVALAVADGAATQGFPTAVRVIPGVVAVAVYLRLR